MYLSENIKRLRLQKKLTQEQLAVRLGVSAQAVSKWERNVTYPDVTLLLPLAKELDISLDGLLDNDSVTIADISGRILSLIHNTDAEKRFNVARDICWQIQRGLFNSSMELKKEYDPNELSKREKSSYVLDDNGFTVVSNGNEPFFALFPQPDGGYGDFLKDKDKLQSIFAALSRTHTMNALIYLYHKDESYVFEGSVLSKNCDIPADGLDEVLNDLMTLNIIRRQDLTVNGKERTLYYSKPSHKLLGVLLMARESCYTGAHCLQSHIRTTPFFRE